MMDVTGHLNSGKSLPININQAKTYNATTEKDVICMKLKELALKRNLMNNNIEGKNEAGRANMSKNHPMVVQVVLTYQYVYFILLKVTISVHLPTNESIWVVFFSQMSPINNS